ncbi:hypothetical protein Aph01nite_74340 [Acrocarpospora phusangensis]|uniref:Trypsin-like serine protease n=1 Tax=Acrocarpospora phusangensis TaxID=1070424 RepID=A0A919QJB6_9ACTN|nr:trypsin-like peptidase domain-containing protein [Acrocarpospora phusangensis]GIH29124.1 hypothetical protein Aph01nite_74340 [Acrocarpospora phusangensis]
MTDPIGLGTPRGPGFQQVPISWQPPAAAVPERAAGRRRGALASATLVALLAGGLAGGAAGWYAGRPGEEPRSAALPRSAAGPVPTLAGLSGTAAMVLPSVVSVEARRGSGSGFAIDQVGHVLTNAHVVEDTDTATVILHDGRRLSARVIGSDEAYDLAVLQVEPGSGLIPAMLARSADVRVGDQVLAIGSPLGLAGTVTSGIVSALDREVRLGNGGGKQTALQTDASINPGNSGGPLVNVRGEVVGVNTVIATLSRRGGNIGIGFAIPVDRAASVAERIIRD